MSIRGGKAQVKDQKKIGERRRFIRHPMCFPLTYQVVKGGSDEYRSRTRNISRGGLLFSARESVDLGSLIVIKMPFQDKVYNVKGKVVHCSQNREAELYDIGVCFQSSSDAFRVRLIEQMYLISEYRDLRRMQSGSDMSLEEASQEWVDRYSRQFQKLYW